MIKVIFQVLKDAVFSGITEAAMGVGKTVLSTLINKEAPGE